MAAGRIGKYERLDVLGHGTSGVVYLAWDSLLRRQVALKEIRADGHELERVLDEARVLDRLRHPNIVHVNGVDEVNGVVLIDMELIRGRNLASVLREGGGAPLPLAEAVRITLAVLSALGYAHERRIVHRDVKPANILIGDDGVVKLTDFGLAEALGTGSVAGGGGTYPYMAPEDFAEDADSDYRSDLWAVGVVLYEMLAGRRPFVAQRVKDPFAWKRAIEQDAPPRLSDLRPDLPSAVTEVVARALSRPKASRYAAASIFADSLSAATAAITATAGAAAITPPIVIPASAPFGPAEAGREEEIEDESGDASFVFGNGAWIASTLDELLVGAARHWDEARRALINGRIERFLRAIGEVHIASLAADLAMQGTQPGANPDRLLRDFLNRSRSEEAEPDPGTLPALVDARSVPPLGRRIPRFRLRRPAPAAGEPMPLLSHPSVPEAMRLPDPIRAPAAEMPTVAAPARLRLREPEEVRVPAAAAAAPAPTEAKREGNGAPVVKHRWWFWPLLALSLSPPAAAITAVPSLALGRMGRFNNLLEAWAVAGVLAAMVLLIGIRWHLPTLARFLCLLPIAAGLVAAGALARETLGPQPTPDALVQVSIATLFPLFVLLVEAATVGKQWRLWIALTVALAIFSALRYGRLLG
ncbi:MAG: serine/threonine protein kinase [Cytophagales bacterium]|nr:serine/threonine protein kinase [Armatimonadota bacterium]